MLVRAWGVVEVLAVFFSHSLSLCACPKGSSDNPARGEGWGFVFNGKKKLKLRRYRAVENYTNTGG